MAEKRLTIPNNLSSINLTKGTDTLVIQVSANCYWCYCDPNGVFPVPPAFLAPGYYQATNPPTVYGPYTPANSGSVSINATTSQPCTLNNPTGVPQTIVVTGGN